VDYRPGNRHLVNAAACARMKKDVLFLNTSRGFVVDAAALAAFLRANPGSRAMIDVHDPYEPIPADYPLLGLANAKLTPHLAAGTQKAKRNMSWVVRDVWRVLSGEEPEFEAG
jgi:D-3-phosphoglycerate dehydrogenase